MNLSYPLDSCPNLGSKINIHCESFRCILKINIRHYESFEYHRILKQDMMSHNNLCSF